MLRARFAAILIPSSYIYVNESVIKFYGYKRDTFKLPYKPAKNDFIYYILASHSGLIYDFILSSS